MNSSSKTVSVVKNNKSNKKSKAARRARMKAESQQVVVYAQPRQQRTYPGNGVNVLQSAQAVQMRTEFVTSSYGNRGGVKIRARECLGIVDAGGLSRYSNINNYMMSPTYFEGTRMSTYATLYEKFRFEKFTLIWSPTCGSSVTGGLLLSWDSDSTDVTPPATESGFRTYLGHRASVTFAPWEFTRMTVVPDKSAMYYTGFLSPTTGSVDERMVYQGQLYLSASTATSSGAGGVLWIEYDLIFDEPQLNPLNTSMINSSFVTTTPADVNLLVGTVPNAGNSTLYSVVQTPTTADQSLRIPPRSRVLLNLNMNTTAAVNLLFKLYNAYGQTVGSNYGNNYYSSTTGQFAARSYINNFSTGDYYYTPVVNSGDLTKISNFVMSVVRAPLTGAVL